jgi:hypothetical protein
MSTSHTSPHCYLNGESGTALLYDNGVSLKQFTIVITTPDCFQNVLRSSGSCAILAAVSM